MSIQIQVNQKEECQENPKEKDLQGRKRRLQRELRVSEAKYSIFKIRMI